MSHEEKIIGTIFNKSNDTYAKIIVSVIVKDKDGKLIDVINESNRIPGQIAPNSELGFSVSREFKKFTDKDEDPGNRGASAEVTIVGVEMVK